MTARAPRDAATNRTPRHAAPKPPPGRAAVWANRLIGGLGDSAFSSLATFAMGLVAVRVLPDELVAMYALLLAGSVVAMSVPRSLVTTPLELSLSSSSTVHLVPLRDTVRLAAKPLAIACAAVPLMALPTLSHVPFAGLSLMGVMAAVATATGVIQGHVRSMMHINGMHLLAAATAFTSAVVTGALLATFISIRADWMHYVLPFGSLAAGHIVSALWWFVAIRHAPMGTWQPLSPLRTRIFYLVPLGAAQLALYLQGVVVVTMLGAAAAATNEAARVAASPTYILGAGIAAFMMPFILRGLRTKPPKQTLSRLYLGIGGVLGLGTAYAGFLAIIGTGLSTIFDRPIDAPLAASRAISAAVDSSGTVSQALLVALEKAKDFAGVSVIGGVVGVTLTVVLIKPLGLYAVPLAQGVTAVIGLILATVIGRRGVRRIQPSAAA